MDALECIYQRKSVRNFSEKKLDEESLKKILRAAIEAPSGKNGQPWKFKVTTDEKICGVLSDLSIYGKWMRKAPCFISVFLDKSLSYDYRKDIQSCGAVMQNIMLSAYAQGIGSCWIGEILPREHEVKSILNINDDKMELMGVIVLGYEKGVINKVDRRPLETFLL